MPCSCQQIRQHGLTTANPEHSDTRLQERQYEVTVATLEDKILQRAVVEVLNAVYEEDFLGFSYGFRPGVARTMRWTRSPAGIYREEGELDTRR